MNSFGIRNELKAYAERERAEKAGRADAIVAFVVLLIVAAYALADYLNQPGVAQ